MSINMENLSERQRKIDEIWHQIFGRFKSVLFWMNDTETEYHYDMEKDFTRDESPMVYKPAFEIIANIGDTVTIDTIIRPIFNFKASK